MKEFAELIDRLFYTYSNNEKYFLLKNYFANTPDPDRGYAVAIIAGAFKFDFFKPSIFYDLILEKVDATLFSLSFDYIGDVAETISLLWPNKNEHADLPSLHEIIETIQKLKKEEIRNYISKLMDQANAKERWALIKLATGELSIGVSARFLKQALANFSNKDIQEIEEVWHVEAPPYIELFAWLEGKKAKPSLIEKVYFHPIMLSHPINDSDLSKITPNDFLAEWKYDGIRVQTVVTKNGKALFSRSGDDISQAFPDVIDAMNVFSVLDGELVVKNQGKIGLFNDLQKRLNRKKPSKDLIKNFPGHIILYDILINDTEDIRNYTFKERREQLEALYKQLNNSIFSLSPLVSFENFNDLDLLRAKMEKYPNLAVEGIMLKRKSSLYIPGRPVGLWYKWKRNPFLIDAVMMYAQRGHGIRSSYYSDYTFGLWKEDTLLPIGKSYFGFTDEEMYKLDKWIRYHTLQKFGPVREVEKTLVLEIAFDAIQLSSRHKSGFALRFPRINRIRWDKPAKEADIMSTLADLYKSQVGIKKK